MTVIDTFLERFADLEAGQLFLLHFNRLAGFGIAADIAIVQLDLERSEAADVDALG